jgi:hypothetical protein
MLQADPQVVRLASWGVQTTNSVLPCVPPNGNFPLSRYNEYLELLKRVGGSAVSRGEGRDANANILLWASGFAGEIRHIGLSWMDSPPTNLVTTLEGNDGASQFGNRHTAFRHIDASWYLWTDR